MTTPAYPEYQFITADRRGAILDIWLNRPQARNAMHEPLEVELYDAFDRADDDDTVRVVTLRGRGEVFSAGHDLKEASENFARTGEARGGIPKPKVRGLSPLWYHRKTLIAGVHGYVGPAAWSMLDNFDFVLAAAGTRFSRETARSGSGAVGGTVTSFLFPMRVLKHLWLMGGWMDAETARDLYYVQRVVPEEELSGEVDGWADCASGLGLEQIAAVKESIHRRFELMGLNTIAGVGNDVPSNQQGKSPNIDFYANVRELGLSEALRRRQSGVDRSITRI